MLTNMVTVSSNSTWKIFDSTVKEVPKTISLNNGENIYFITFTDSTDENITNTYTFTVYKSFKVKLNY